MLVFGFIVDLSNEKYYNKNSQNTENDVGDADNNKQWQWLNIDIIEWTAEVADITSADDEKDWRRQHELIEHCWSGCLDWRTNYHANK